MGGAVGGKCSELGIVGGEGGTDSSLAIDVTGV